MVEPFKIAQRLASDLFFPLGYILDLTSSHPLELHGKSRNAKKHITSLETVARHRLFLNSKASATLIGGSSKACLAHACFEPRPDALRGCLHLLDLLRLESCVLALPLPYCSSTRLSGDRVAESSVCGQLKAFEATKGSPPDCSMTETKKIKGQGDVAWIELGTEPSSASTEDNVEDNSEHQADNSEEGECRKGTWTLEEDRELSRLIEVFLPQPNFSVLGP